MCHRRGPWLLPQAAARPLKAAYYCFLPPAGLAGPLAAAVCLGKDSLRVQVRLSTRPPGRDSVSTQK